VFTLLADLHLAPAAGSAHADPTVPVHRPQKRGIETRLTFASLCQQPENQGSHSNTFSQLDHSITECSGLEGTSVGHLVQSPAEARSPTAGCTGPCPGRFWISPEKEIFI